MKSRDLANLLNRAGAALETPEDLTDDDRRCLIADLLAEAEEVSPPEHFTPESVERGCFPQHIGPNGPVYKEGTCGP